MKKALSFIIIFTLAMTCSIGFGVKGDKNNNNSKLIIASLEVVDSNKIILISESSREIFLRNLYKQLKVREADNSKLSVEKIENEDFGSNRIRSTITFNESLYEDKNYELRYHNQKFEFAGYKEENYLNDVAVVMLDKKHLRIYFPVAMKKTSVENKSSYGLIGLPDDAITLVEYDSDTMSASISLSKTYASGIIKDYFVIYNSETTKVFNEDQSKVIADLDGGDLHIEFAISDSEAEGPLLESGIYEPSNNTLKLTFDQFIDIKNFSLISEVILVSLNNSNDFQYDFIGFEERSIMLELKSPVIGGEVIEVSTIASDIVFNPYTLENMVSEEYYMAIPYE